MRVGKIIFGIFALFFLSACNEKEVIVEPDGYGTSIVLSQDKFEFSQRGGEAVLKCTNLPKCYICELEDKLTGISYQPERDEQHIPVSVKCEGIVITALDKISVNMTVAASDKSHHWVLTMQSGNAFKTVDIVQK